MPKVLILHTGGTLGMRGTPLEPDEFAASLTETVPELGKLADVDIEIVCNLDSSDIGPGVWTTLADTVAARRMSYDGFVVIHGTDTMAYSASALAFALGGLDRPVVFTGAQRPLSALRTDARRNLADAVDVASRPLPEVTICFDGLLLRGCRATKSNANDYRGFESPGTEPLARLGTDIQYTHPVLRPIGQFECDSRFSRGVACLHVTPGLTAAEVEHFVDAPGLKGIVLAAYGVGTVPTNVEPLAPAIERAVDSGIEVLVVTQSTGNVDLEQYANGLPLARAGALSGGRMRIEAATTKLMHAVAAFEDREDRRDYLLRDVAGEMG